MFSGKPLKGEKSGGRGGGVLDPCLVIGVPLGG